MKPNNCLFTTALSLWLLGCVTTATVSPKLPDFALPSTIAYPEAWSSLPASVKMVNDEANKNEFKPANEKTWWQNIEDETLAELIQSALIHAPDVRSAIINVYQSRKSEELALSSLWPSLNINSSVSRRALQTKSPLNGDKSYGGGLDASWEIPLFSGQVETANAAQYDLWEEQLTLADAQVTLTSEVARLYINIRSAQWQLMASKANLAKQEESLSLTGFKVKAGLTSILALEQARANVAQSRAQLPDLQLAKRRAIRRLAVLSGFSPQSLMSKLSVEKNANIKLPPLPSLVNVNIPIDSIRKRPDVRRAEFALLAGRERAKAGQLQRYPSLSIAGSWSFSSLTFRGLTNPVNLVSSVIARISQSIFDGGARLANAELQALAVDSLLVRYEQTLLIALEEMENSLDEISQSHFKVSLLMIANQATISANDIARAEYSVGLVDYMTLLDSDRDRLSIQNTLVQARADEWLAFIQLFKAMGGDWQSIYEL